MEAIEQFSKWASSRHEYAKEWKKKSNKKIIGYLCTYTPEELFYAADILPVRIFGGHESDISIVEPHIHGMYCPFCRSCLSEGLKGRYDYTDGIVIGQSCLHIRQVFFTWQRHIKHEFEHYIYVPHCNQGAGRYEYLEAELLKLKENMEKWIGHKITDADIDKGIEIVNKNRQLLRKVWEYRKMANPPLTGSEAMDIVISSQTTDKREHNKALEALLKELPNRKLDRETGTRLIIIGSEDDDREFTRMVEYKMNMPATFVVEEHCVGTRYFWNDVIPEKNRLLAISKRYMDRPSCPSKDWPIRTRIPHILKLIEDFKVEAAVMMQQKFCDPAEFDIPTITRTLKEKGIPTYFLEFDVTVPVGQFQTRMEAFLETMIDLV